MKEPTKAELKREIEAKLEIISTKETIISKQSQSLISNSEEITRQREIIVELEEKNTGLLEEIIDLKNKLEQTESVANDYKLSHTNLKKELDALKLDKHLPRNRLLRKFANLLLVLDTLL